MKIQKVRKEVKIKIKKAKKRPKNDEKKKSRDKESAKSVITGTQLESR